MANKNLVIKNNLSALQQLCGAFISIALTTKTHLPSELDILLTKNNNENSIT